MIVVGPTPPPIHGVVTATGHMLEAMHRAGALRAHLDTRDGRPLRTIGKLDGVNVWLGVKHAAELAWLLALNRDADLYLPISQARWGFVRDATMIAAARLARRSVVIHLHGGLFREFYFQSGPIQRRLIRTTLRAVDEAWVLTKAHEHIFDGLIAPTRVRTLENAADDIRSVVARPGAVPRDDAELRILFLSNLSPEKGCIDLLAAVDRMGAEAVGLAIRLAGEADDALADEVRRRAEPLARRGVSVELAGVRTGAEKAAEFKWADVFALPSRYRFEGQPIALLEAMSAGLPIISTTHSGIPYTVRQDREALLVAPGDISAIAQALKRLRADRELRERLGRNARARYEEKYTLEDYYAAVARLLAATGGTPMPGSLAQPRR